MNIAEEKMPVYENKVRMLTENIESVVVCKRSTIALLLTALLCRGHVLLEDVPGVGKTMLVNSLAKSLSLSFQRVQCTPDMLPGDITGFTMYNIHTGQSEYKQGPIMSQLFLADEINRTSPKTQAALLEAMEERQVTVDGTTYPLPKPFMVLATQNPVESEGTFPLPEAQLDRFLMRVRMGYPSKEQEIELLSRFDQADPFEALQPVAGVLDVLELQQAAAGVFVSEAIKEYIVELIAATRAAKYVSLGASPRAGLNLMKASQAFALINGGSFVTPEDVRAIAVPVLAHRLILNREGKMKQISSEKVIRDILAQIPVPPML